MSETRENTPFIPILYRESEDSSDDSLFQDDIKEATRRSLIETHRSNGGEEIM